MSTRERILEASLVLFNESGERNVTTNHIAAHMGISPGNLYYHFKNKKEIIFELFSHYEAKMKSILTLPEGRIITTNDKVHYLTETFRELWAYRFMHRDMESLLNASPELHARYHDFFRYCYAQIRYILLALNDAGIIYVSDDDANDLALNIWIVITSWFSFLQSNLLIIRDGAVSQEMLLGGIYQVFSLERPYLTDAAREEVMALQQAFIPRPAWLNI